MDPVPDLDLVRAMVAVGILLVVDGAGNLLAFADDDVLQFNGSTWSLYFDGSDVGLSSVDVLALHSLDADSLLMAFNTAVTLNGIAFTPTDIARFDATSLGSNTAGTFSMYFNGADVGLSASSEKIDAVEVLQDGRLLISTTGNPAALPTRRRRALDRSRRRIADAVARLPGRYREVFLLRTIEHVPFDEIAARTGRSAGAERMAWVRALEQLRLLLEEVP